MKYIDSFLNSITMYRLMYQGLIIMAIASVVFGFMGLLPFGGVELAFSALVLVAACYGINYLLASFFKVPRNVESAYISALILFFVLIPAKDTSSFLTLLYASALAMGSKYILGMGGRHIFNPAAIAIVILGILGVASSGWWVASPILSPFVIVIGLLIVRKLRRFSMFLSFILTAVIFIGFSGYLASGPPLDRLWELVVSWPLIYFGAFMFTEPQTTPPTNRTRLIYGMIVGALFGSSFQFGPVYSTPELALVIGNVFSYLVSSKQVLRLKLQRKTKLDGDTYDFTFKADQKLQYKPGQYLEWTLPYPHPDTRGNRRYFTVASSPSEKEIKLGIKIANERSSGFKKSLLNMKEGGRIFASHLAGDFVLPVEKNKKLAFVAGGIGITPFRSMIQYLLDNNDRRDMVLFYSSATADGFVYKDLLEKAEKKVGLKLVYLLTNKQDQPINWKGRVGRMTKEVVENETPDYKERTFYLSGPEAMVASYKKLLLGMGVSRRNIVTDYFPGY